MKQMKTILKNGDWSTSGKVSVRGYAFNWEGRLLRGAEFADYMCCDSESALLDKLKGINGTYAIVHNSEHLRAIAIDPSRLYPIYYRRTGNSITVADDPHTLLRKGDTIDPTAETEYRAMGVPFCGKTLVKEIRQVLPGYCMTEDGTNFPIVTRLSKAATLITPTAAEFANKLERVFSRIVEAAAGRQIAIPLSGGQDSRLIACMLKKLDYKNVIAYTVGVPGNAERNTAEMVAKQLGLTWYEIDTTQEELKSLIDPNDKEFIRFADHEGQLGCFTYIWDYAAIRYLKSHGLIADDAVVMPGHAADAEAGTYINKSGVTPTSTAKEIAKGICCAVMEYEHESQQQAVEQVAESLLAEGYSTFSVANHICCANRLAHNIVNSSRVYDLMGHEVLLPYMDKEFINFFCHSTYDSLYGNRFFNNFVHNHVFVPMGVGTTQRAIPKEGDNTLKFIKRQLKSLIPDWLLSLRPTLADPTGESLMVKPLIEDLRSKGLWASGHRPRLVNEILSEWYLARVRRLIESCQTE